MVSKDWKGSFGALFEFFCPKENIEWESPSCAVMERRMIARSNFEGYREGEGEGALLSRAHVSQVDARSSRI